MNARTVAGRNEKAENKAANNAANIAKNTARGNAYARQDSLMHVTVKTDRAQAVAARNFGKISC